MFLDEELQELKERISQKSDFELLQIVEVEYDDYRPEAIEFAKAELTKRSVPFKPTEPDRTGADEDADDEQYRAVSAEGRGPCSLCGGRIRSGLLFADKELTILFPEDNEERFVQALACRHCGALRLVVDFGTDVES